MQKLSTKNQVYDLLFASTASAALGAAIETELLWMLAERPLEGEDVAQVLNIPIKRCLYWLQLLQSLGILDQTPQGYVPSALTRNAILDTKSQSSWKHLALDERERSAGVHNLAVFIGEPGSLWKAQGLVEPKDYVEKMKVNLDRARQFTRMLYEVHQYLGNELAALLDMAGVRRLMDLGGGSGVVSMALLRRYPDLAATVVDIENVCIAGREIAAENSLSDRMTYQSVDFSVAELPGGFDRIMFCDVMPEGVPLYRKMWRALNQGGRLIVVFHFSPEENAAPASRLEWTFLDSLEDPNFSIPTIAQTRAQVILAGFHPLPGEHTLSDQRIVIQACK